MRGVGELITPSGLVTWGGTRWKTTLEIWTSGLH
jgi:hypothetical protein